MEIRHTIGRWCVVTSKRTPEELGPRMEVLGAGAALEGLLESTGS